MKPHLIVDYTQFSTFRYCPLKWYEKYVRGVQKKYEGQRDDALALGILYHNGMENLYLNGTPSVSEEVINEIGPKPEALNMITNMLRDYRIQMYPMDTFKVEGVENALMLRLNDRISILAKIDMHFLASQDMKIFGGSNKDTMDIAAGRWGFEDKTKNNTTNPGKYIKTYRISWQPIFQTLVLREKFGDEVQGIVINVAEKKDYDPKRKCRSCGEYSLHREWIPADDQFKCPVCGNVQKIAKVDPAKLDAPTNFFRMKFAVPETAGISNKEFFEQQKNIIEEIAEQMYKVKFENGSVNADWDNCVPRGSYYECEFADAHTNLRDPLELQEFVQIEKPLKYMGVEQ